MEMVEAAERQMREILGRLPGPLSPIIRLFDAIRAQLAQQAAAPEVRDEEGMARAICKAAMETDAALGSKRA